MEGGPNSPSRGAPKGKPESRVYQSRRHSVLPGSKEAVQARYGLSEQAVSKARSANADKKSSGQIVGKIKQTVTSGIQSASTGVKTATETGKAAGSIFV